MRVLITGICGFAGSYLAEYMLTKNNVSIFGIKRKQDVIDNIRHIVNRLNLVECDITHQSALTRIIRRIKPDRIFHLAAQTFCQPFLQNLRQIYNVNLLGTINLYESVRKANIHSLLHVACSSAEYGITLPRENFIKETNPFRPVNSYAVSKIGQDVISCEYWSTYQLKIIRTRAFNQTGPRERAEFVCAGFAKQIAEVELGLREPVIYAGNLKTKRDFTDVRDIVKGYWLALEKGLPGEVYNLCSGRTYAVKEILDILLSMSNTKVKIKVNSKRVKSVDVPLQIGDYSKFYNQTGWKPRIPLDQTLRDLLNYWRRQLRK